MAPTAVLARHHRLLSLLVALLAFVGQITVAFAPLAEGRGGRMASHVEASGSPLHVAQHDEAKCISCQARSMHGAPSRPEQPAIALGASNPPRVVRDARERADATHLQASPRAPPVLS